MGLTGHIICVTTADVGDIGSLVIMTILIARPRAVGGTNMKRVCFRADGKLAPMDAAKGLKPRQWK